MTQRNITRYTYETTSFQGWRLSICRRWNQFTKYFSDRQYGSEEEAFKAALEMRDRIFAELQRHPEDPRAVFEQFKNGIQELASDSQEALNPIIPASPADYPSHHSIAADK